jgi:hypothetical protein
MALAANEVKVLEEELAKQRLERKQLAAPAIVTSEGTDRMHTLDISIEELQRLISEKISAIQSARDAEAARIVDEKKAREASGVSGRKRAKCEHSKVKSTCEECKAISYNEQTKREADAVVAANLLQIEALGPELEATRARLAIEDEGVRREAYGRYAVELEDQRGRCLDRVIDVHAGILPQPPPMAAASSPCPAAELVKQVKPEPVDD